MPTIIQNDLDGISDFDPQMWELLREKRIFATGCTGFLGEWIIRSFLHLNQKFNLKAELYCLTRNKKKNEERFSGIHFVEGDIQSFAFPKGGFDLVIHGATEVAAYQKGSDPSLLLDVSFVGTKRLIDFSKQASVKKILFLSSGAAYGTQPLELPLLEESYSGAPDPRNSKSTYGEAKRLGELLLFNQEIPATSARIFATYGPFLPLESQYAFSNFLESFLKQEKIVIKSNGLTTRSYLYAGDLVLWLWILLLKGKDKEIYNVGSEEEISIHDLAKKMSTLLGAKTEIEIQGRELSFGRYIPSNHKIRTEFKIDQLVPLETGIMKSFEFLKDPYAV